MTDQLSDNNPTIAMQRILIQGLKAQHVNTVFQISVEIRVCTRLGETDKIPALREQLLNSEKHIAAYDEELAAIPTMPSQNSIQADNANHN